MKKNRNSMDRRFFRYPHAVVRETLANKDVTLTNFYFRYGANIYVFTYEKNGEQRHTFIDTGYPDHQRVIFPILQANGVCLEKIDNIIITHRHPDHCGLAASLAERSESRILVHANFKDFVDGNITPMEKKWLGKFDPSRMAASHMAYLEPGNGNDTVTIGGMHFPRMPVTVDLGGDCRLEIITCPESNPSHSPDQLLVLYSPRKVPYSCEAADPDFLPTDEIIFSGDLWLMRGPIFEKSLRSLRLRFKFMTYHLLALLLGRRITRPSPQEQDAAAKDAIKNGFCLIRVKPGHGREFLGSNLIPQTLFADRDLLVHLGYSMDADKSILKSDGQKPAVAALLEEAYERFLATLTLWRNLGYGEKEIIELLVRIYTEQSGGGKLVEQDRIERRIRIKKTLHRLASETARPADLQRIAAAAAARVN